MCFCRYHVRELHQDETSQVELFLNSVPILASLTRDEKMMLVDALEEQIFAPAAKVINQVCCDEPVCTKCLCANRTALLRERSSFQPRSPHQETLNYAQSCAGHQQAKSLLKGTLACDADVLGSPTLGSE